MTESPKSLAWLWEIKDPKGYYNNTALHQEKFPPTDKYPRGIYANVIRNLAGKIVRVQPRSVWEPVDTNALPTRKDLLQGQMRINSGFAEYFDKNGKVMLRRPERLVQVSPEEMDFINREAERQRRNNTKFETIVAFGMLQRMRAQGRPLTEEREDVTPETMQEHYEAYVNILEFFHQHSQRFGIDLS